MRIDLVPSEEWERASDALRAQLQIGPEESVRVHPGLGPGLFEVVQGLAQIYSHKRALGVVKGNSPAFDHVIPYFVKEAYQMQSVTWPKIDVATWVEALKKETAFVMLAEDHPVVGALENVDALDAALNEKKIFVIRVSHSSHLFRRETLRPYTLRVCSLAGDLAYSVGGSRVRVPPTFSHRVPWSLSELKTRITQARAAMEDRAAVESLESAFPDRRFFKSVTTRLHDRAVLVFEDVSGEALLKRAAERAGFQTFGSQADTANLCRWDSTRLLKGWWEGVPSDDALRGLVVFSAELCRQKDLAKHLRSAYEELVAQQVW